MKTKLVSITCIILLAAVSFSCDSWLDIEVKSVMTGDRFWKSESDFMPYLYGIYNRYRVHMDNLEITEDRGEMWTQGGNDRFSSYHAQVISEGQTIDWTGWYTTIGHCNFLLYQMENFDFSDQTLKRQVSAETHALRAAVYFELAKIFGDVPLVLTPTLSEKEPLYARSPVAEVFVQINNDINEALSLMTSDGYVDKYRFSKPAVYALQADVKMWSASVLSGGERDYLDAINAINQVESSGVALLPNYANIFDNRRNNEIVLSVYLNREEYTSSRYNYSFPAGTVANVPTSSQGQGAYCLSFSAVELFDAYPADRRIPRTFVAEFRSGEFYRYWPTKFWGTVYSGNVRSADSDIIIYRLSNLYLLKAEAYAALNRTAESLEYLNKVRTRAGIPAFTDTNPAVLKKEILDELGREMMHELKRWWDLRRAHATGVIDIYTFIPSYEGKTTPFYWAVHRTVMAKNELLVQTAGY